MASVTLNKGYWETTITTLVTTAAPMVSVRNAKAYRAGQSSLVVVIPAEWARGMEIEPGDELVLEYNGELRIRKTHELIEKEVVR